MNPAISGGHPADLPTDQSQGRRLRPYSGRRESRQSRRRRQILTSVDSGNKPDLTVCLCLSTELDLHRPGAGGFSTKTGKPGLIVFRIAKFVTPDNLESR